LPTPAENLACDEALLDGCEDGDRDEVLRCWEPREAFVVIGYANRMAVEVNVAACAVRGIPIYRRCSGGGTVLQGPGCLNYALILKIDETGPLRSITAANRFIMERNRAALSNLPGPSSSGHPAFRIQVRGHTDLALDGRKFSGNAQRRKRRFLLFHGTFLLQFDLALVEAVLPLPTRQPAYRQNRSHQEFLTNLSVPADAVKRALQETWRAFDPPGTLPHETIVSLAGDKYGTTGWNQKF